MGKSPEEMMQGGNSIDNQPQAPEVAHEATAEDSENPIDPVEHALAEANALKEQIAQRMAEQKIDIEKKIGDREALIREGIQLTDSLQKAHELLDYLSALDEAGEIKNEKDVAKFAEVRLLVSSIDKQVQDLDSKIAQLSDVPDVKAGIIDQAQQEDAARDIVRETDIINAETTQEKTEIMNAITTLKENYNRDMLLAQDKRVVAREAATKITDFIDSTKSSLSGKMYDEIYGMASKIDTAEDVENFFTTIQEMRLSLGMFKGKEKAMLDLIRSKRQLFDDLVRVRADMRSTESVEEEYDQGQSQIAEQIVNYEKKYLTFKQSIIDRIADEGQRKYLLDNLKTRDFDTFSKDDMKNENIYRKAYLIKYPKDEKQN